MVASVPELHMRTFSTDGTALTTNSAMRTSRGLGMPKLVPCSAAFFTASTTTCGACPRIAGPHVPTWSTYSLSSASQTEAPLARTAKNGFPPTARNARTGEFTPPGIHCNALSNRACDFALNRMPRQNTVSPLKRTRKLLVKLKSE